MLCCMVETVVESAKMLEGLGTGADISDRNDVHRKDMNWLRLMLVIVRKWQFLAWRCILHG